MSFRIPNRFIAVFGVTALVALAVGFVFFLGLVSEVQIRGQAKSIRTFTDTAITHPQHEQTDD